MIVNVVYFSFVLLFVGLGGGFLGSIIEENRLKQKQARFKLRESLSKNKIFESYYADGNIEKRIFLKVWSDISDILNLDSSKLRPEDRFNEELSPVLGYLVEDELIDLEEYLMEQLKYLDIKLPQSFNLKKIECLDDIILLLCRSSSDDSPP